MPSLADMRTKAKEAGLMKLVRIFLLIPLLLNRRKNIAEIAVQTFLLIIVF